MMDGTFRMPEKAQDATNASTSTDLQKSIFAGPPTGTSGTSAVAGTKRAREEDEEKAESDSEEEEDVEMEVDEEDDDDD